MKSEFLSVCNQNANDILKYHFTYSSTVFLDGLGFCVLFWCACSIFFLIVLNFKCNIYLDLPFVFSPIFMYSLSKAQGFSFP